MSYFLNVNFLRFIVFFISFPSCFCEDDDYDYGTLAPMNYQEIVFRIARGIPASLGDVPYQVAFRAQSSENFYATFCGGTIIQPHKIVSAAHCFYSQVLSNCFNRGRAPKKKIMHYFAVAGTLKNKDYYHRIDSEENGQWRRLRAVYYPSSYHFPKHDVSVVFLRSPFIFNSYINSIPIASYRQEYTGQCLVSGYGRLSRTLLSPILYKANLQIIPTYRCNKIHKTNMKYFVCTSAAVSDVEKGDSGGPLVCHEGSQRVLAGIVSGNRRTISGDGSFFTRVSSYHTYITKSVDTACTIRISKWVLVLINSAFLLN